MLNYKEYLKESQGDQVVVLDNGQGGNMFKTVKYGSKNSIAILILLLKSLSRVFMDRLGLFILKILIYLLIIRLLMVSIYQRWLIITQYSKML